jgi:hypothetical protein
MPILYKVVVGSLEDLGAFETAVTKYLNEGYIPAGGACYAEGKIVQSVARNTDIPIGPPMGPNMGPPMGPRVPPGGGGRPVINQ